MKWSTLNMMVYVKTIALVHIKIDDNFSVCVVCRLREQLLQRLRVRAVGFVGRVHKPPRLDASPLPPGVRPLPHLAAGHRRRQRDEHALDVGAGPGSLARPISGRESVEPDQRTEPTEYWLDQANRHDG